MTEGGAGMTEEGAGMTEEGAGMADFAHAGATDVILRGYGRAIVRGVGGLRQALRVEDVALVLARRGGGEGEDASRH